MTEAFEALRMQHAADLLAVMPSLVARLRWSADALQRERQRRLRILLGTAKARSSWHRERLRHIDSATVTEDVLATVPPMTKADLMEHFDAIVTDPSVTRAVVDDHVETLPSNPYLFDRLIAVASGGSSGRRGVFVYDWDEFMTFSGSVRRWRIRSRAPQPPMVNLWAPAGAHVSHLALRVFPPPVAMESISPITPLPQIVERLNAVQPKSLSGYASTLALLAGEQRAGRLAIAPETVMTCGEPLFDDVRAEIEAVWPAHVDNYYGMSEGLYAFGCEAGDAMHLPDDLFCIEPVDDDGNPVPPGTPATKVYLTNLFNMTQPLIRYEVTDQLVVLDEPCPCGCAHRRIDQVVGRTDDVFAYPGGVRVHPLAVRAPLGRARAISEYQVVQTPRGVHLRLCADPSIDVGAVTSTVAFGLASAGLDQPQVTAEVVAELARLGSGKLRRFVPLPPS
jgi:phenylacetate-coenzyme A ligase PaaK-like adenylate-forming protein